MPAMPALSGLTRLRWMSGTERKNLSQNRQAQVRLVPKHNCPMRQIGIPSPPPSGALNRAEHAALRSWIKDSVGCRKLEPIQFRWYYGVTRRTDHRDLLSFQLL